MTSHFLYLLIFTIIVSTFFAFLTRNEPRARWRLGLAGDDEAAGAARPEREPLPTPDTLARRWADEWDALDAWLATVTDEWLDELGEGVPFWQMLAHVANHGTQHRSEAAVILTDAGRSPGDLDMIFFAEELAQTSDEDR